MLTLNLKRLFSLYNVTKPIGFLSKHGFSKPTAMRLSNGTYRTLKPSQIEALCYAFKCTPNDLFEWKPGDSMNHPEEHPLSALIRGETPSINKILQSYSASELEQLAKTIAGMKPNN